MDFDKAFDAIVDAMKRAAAKADRSIASKEAERQGLVEIGAGQSVNPVVWEKTDGGRTIRFRWRWYDPSQVFSIRPDINVLTAEIISAGGIERQAEERFED